MWGAGSCLVLWKVSDAVALGGRARGGWVRVLSRVPSSSCPARRSSGGVFARWGHRRCLYPRAREHSGPVGGSSAVVGPRPPPGGWVRGRWGSGCAFARRGHRRCLYPPGPGTHGSGEWDRPGGGLAGWGCGPGPLLSSRGSRGRVGPVGRVLLLSSSVWWVGPPCSARVGCGVSGRLVRRRCRSGRCAGGTRGRGWTARWW